MKMEIRRYGITITPENAEDEAYVEEVLGLKDCKTEALCIRENAIGLNRIAHIAITKRDV